LIRPRQSHLARPLGTPSTCHLTCHWQVVLNHCSSSGWKVNELFYLPPTLLVETHIMNTNKSIAGLLTTWLVGLLRNPREPLTWSPLGPGSASCRRLVTRLSITNYRSPVTNHLSPTVQISSQIRRCPARSSIGLRLGIGVFAHVTHVTHVTDVTASNPCSERAPLTDGELW
jgi:hypothetical protein